MGISHLPKYWVESNGSDGGHGTGKRYYWNIQTEKTQWECPKGDPYRRKWSETTDATRWFDLTKLRYVIKEMDTKGLKKRRIRRVIKTHEDGRRTYVLGSVQ